MSVWVCLLSMRMKKVSAFSVRAALLMMFVDEII